MASFAFTSFGVVVLAALVAYYSFYLHKVCAIPPLRAGRVESFQVNSCAMTYMYRPIAMLVNIRFGTLLTLSIECSSHVYVVEPCVGPLG